jgi:adenine-specific DNA-methyltransferase
VIKYLGSKRTLIPDLVRIVSHFPELTSAVDLFSGTGRVGHALKRLGLSVQSNDLNAYAYALAMCYVAADREAVEPAALQLIAEFNRMPGSPGYFTQAFCQDSRFFQPQNGAKVDAIREAIEQKDLPPRLKYVLLVALMEAADRVDSTCGVHMAYVKSWAARANNPLELRFPDVLPAARAGACAATQLDAVEAAEQLQADIVYLDPPYNQHSYLSNYHIWETLVLWDKPEYYGIACKRVDCRTRKSAFNARQQHASAFGAVLRHAARAPLVIVSFNDEGFQTRSELEASLREYGDIYVISKDFKRYVGARIGIHNPEGKRVGEVSHVRNEEYIYLLATPHHAKSPVTRQRLAEFSAAEATTRSEVDTQTRGHTRPEQSLLASLREHGELSARDLERLTGLTHYRVSSFLRRLVQHGHVSVRAADKTLYRCASLDALATETPPPKNA